MESSYDMTRYDTLVGRFMAVQDITVGNPEKDYIVRYRGRLRSEDTEAAYDQLADQLRPLNVTPLFRWDNGQHAVILVPSRTKPKASNSTVNVIMFLLTLVSVSVAGALNSTDTITALPANPLQAALVLIHASWPFTVSLLAILLTHEFGHYLMSRHHGVHATLPYFVPFLPPIGTMGAVIVMKEPPKNRRQLLDIGLAGPLAGLAVAIPVVLIGLSLSQKDTITPHFGQIVMQEGNSVLYLLLKFAIFHQLPPSPASSGR